MLPTRVVEFTFFLNFYFLFFFLYPRQRHRKEKDGKHRMLYFTALASAFSSQMKPQKARVEHCFSRMPGLTFSSLTCHAQHGAPPPWSNYASKHHNVTARCSSSQCVLKDIAPAINCRVFCMQIASPTSVLCSTESRGLLTWHLLLTHQAGDTAVRNFPASSGALCVLPRTTHSPAAGRQPAYIPLAPQAHLDGTCPRLGRTGYSLSENTSELRSRESSSCLQAIKAVRCRPWLLKSTCLKCSHTIQSVQLHDTKQYFSHACET